MKMIFTINAARWVKKVTRRDELLVCVLMWEELTGNKYHQYEVLALKRVEIML